MKNKAHNTATCMHPPWLPATGQEHLLYFGIPLKKLNMLQRAPKRIWDSQSWPVPQKQNSETTFKDADGGRDKGACQDVKTCPSFSIFPFPDRQKSLSLIERPACFERRHFCSSDISAEIRVSRLVPPYNYPTRSGLTGQEATPKSEYGLDFWKWPIWVGWRLRWTILKRNGLHYSAAVVWLSAKKHMTQQNRKRIAESPGARPEKT